LIVLFQWNWKSMNVRFDSYQAMPRTLVASGRLLKCVDHVILKSRRIATEKSLHHDLELPGGITSHSGPTAPGGVRDTAVESSTLRKRSACVPEWWGRASERFRSSPNEHSPGPGEYDL